MSAKPEISTVSTVATFAGQSVLAVNVTYPGEDTQRITFQGMLGVEGGVVFMGEQRVVDPARFGPFGKEWVRNFWQ